MTHPTVCPIVCRLLWVAWFAAGALAGANAKAQSATPGIETAQDCLDIHLQASDDPSLTRAERIAKLDAALLQALNNSDLCQSIGAAVGDGDGGGDGGGGVSGDGEGGGAQANAGSGSAGADAGDSAPASDIQGDAPDSVDESIPDGVASAPADAKPQVGGNETSPPSSNDNGKLPDDIPSAENDDIIAKQFRQAALDETDPQAKAKLWNEYRRYKGLPVRDVPDTDDHADASDS